MSPSSYKRNKYSYSFFHFNIYFYDQYVYISHYCPRKSEMYWLTLVSIYLTLYNDLRGDVVLFPVIIFNLIRPGYINAFILPFLFLTSLKANKRKSEKECDQKFIVKVQWMRIMSLGCEILRRRYKFLTRIFPTRKKLWQMVGR